MGVKQAIIIGGGASILRTPKDELRERLNNRFVIACNTQYRFWPHTFGTWIDREPFYENEIIYNYDDFSSEKLWVCHYYTELLESYWCAKKTSQIPSYPPNHIPLIPKLDEFDSTLQKGVWGNLCGIFATTLAGYLMNWEGEIFLLGFDDRVDPLTNKTHWFSNEDCGYNYKGIQKHIDGRLHEKFSNPNHELHSKPWKPFVEEPALNKLKIWNVSPDSWIPVFDKIDYPEFLNKLEHTIYPQDQLRIMVRNKLKGIQCAMK